MVSTFVALLADDVEQTNGFVIFSLTNGPEYHVSQVSKSTSLLVHWVCANGFVCNYLSVLLCLNLLQNSLFDLLSSSKFLLAEFSILLFISAIKDCIWCCQNSHSKTSFASHCVAYFIKTIPLLSFFLWRWFFPLFSDSLVCSLFLSVRQIADAVVVARSLGATLVVPDIRGSKPGDQRLALRVSLLRKSLSLLLVYLKRSLFAVSYVGVISLLVLSKIYQLLSQYYG